MKITRRNHPNGPVADLPPGFGVHILLGPGFNRQAVVSLSAELGRRGIPAVEVALHTGVRSATALLLSELAAGSAAQCIVLAGDEPSIGALLVCPLMHRVLRAAVRSGGQIAALAGALPTIDETQLLNDLPTEALLRQSGPLAPFVEQLITAAMRPPAKALTGTANRSIL